jgi:hypothetical protein
MPVILSPGATQIQFFLPSVCTMPSPGAGTVFNIRFFGFGSQHDEAVIFALADGSVRQISKIVDRSLIRLLAMRADGSPIPSEY